MKNVIILQLIVVDEMKVKQIIKYRFLFIRNNVSKTCLIVLSLTLTLLDT